MKNLVVFKWEPTTNVGIVPSRDPHKISNIQYDAAYVNKHFDMASRWIPDLNYICVTDKPEGLSSEITTVPLWDFYMHLGGCLNRLYMFSEEVREFFGDLFLAIDLDTVFTADFSHYWEGTENKFAASKNPEERKSKRSIRYHPGTALINTGSLSKVWEDFIDNPESNIKTSRYFFTGTDQSWFNYWLMKNNVEVAVLEGVYEARTHIIRAKKLPEGCNIIEWSGPRDPNEAQWKSIPWLREYL